MLIATRVLKLRGATPDTEIPIRIFALEESDGTWFCRCEIDWPNQKWSRAAGGFDAVQAIILGLQMIGVAIYTSDYHQSDSLMWERPGAGYGFPVPHNMRDLLIGDDAKFF